MEGVNVRYLDELPEAVAFAVTDVSFISLTMILPRIFSWLAASMPGEVSQAGRQVTQGSVVALIKPQFEAGREKVGRGGIVRDPLVHQEVTERIIAFCAGLGWRAAGLIESPILGAEGNKEFLIWLQRGE